MLATTVVCFQSAKIYGTKFIFQFKDKEGVNAHQTSRERKRKTEKQREKVERE